MSAVRSNRMREIVPFALVAVAVAAFVAMELANHGFPINSYKAFYCGGHAILQGANPYLMEPLRSCEHAAYVSPSFPSFAVEPAPLPGYSLLALAAIAWLPPGPSHWLFSAILVAALALTGWAMRCITGRSVALVTLIMLSGWLVDTAYGQIPPLFVAALAVTGWALERGRFTLAGVLACAGAFEPHLGLPLMLGVFVAVPKCRMGLLAGCAALLAADVAATGPATALAYFTTYLPVHAATEIVASDQYSLTHLLHVAGVGDRLAMAAGTLSYAVMTLLGIVAGWRAARYLEMPSLIAFAPPAFALFGGTFVHDVQMIAALPLAIALVSRVRPVPWVLAAAAALLCLDWNQAGSRLLLLAAVASALAMGRLIFADRGPAAWAKAAALAIVLCAGLIGLNRLPSPVGRLAPVAVAAFPADVPASLAWGALLRADPYWSRSSLLFEARKLPTWIGLALLAGFALTLRPRPAERVVREEGFAV